MILNRSKYYITGGDYYFYLQGPDGMFPTRFLYVQLKDQPGKGVSRTMEQPGNSAASMYDSSISPQSLHPRAVINKAQQKQERMRMHGITFENGKYAFNAKLYDTLQGAVTASIIWSQGGKINQ